MSGIARLCPGDCVRHMDAMKRGCTDLVFADPPFNIGYEYDVYKDSRPREDYLGWCDRWLRAIQRVLKPTGTFWLAIGDDYAAELRLLCDRYFFRRSWVVWHYTFGVHLTAKWGRDHTHLLYYTVDDKQFTWNPDEVRMRSNRQEIGDKRADPRGRVPGDVWTIPRIVGNAKERTDHPCQMPEAALERIILACSDPGDVVGDPFLGSGTTAAMALKHGRSAWGVELSEEYLTQDALPRAAKFGRTELVTPADRSTV